MKKLLLSLAIISLFVSQITAQNPITTLVHAGTTTPYYGQNSLVDAYTASVNGDYLYLSPGYYAAPTAIAKGVKIIGSGHFPDSATVAKRTYILSGLTINAGADSLRLEGLYINGDINYAAASSINYVNVFRCRLGSAFFTSSSATASKNNCSYEECFIFGGILGLNYGNNLLIKHCIIGGQIDLGDGKNFAAIGGIGGNALIDGNIILTNNNFTGTVNTSTIQNNIVYSTNYLNVGDWGKGNYFKNNLFLKNNVSSSVDSFTNNFWSVSQSNIFVNQTGNAIDYTHDYHLKSPTTYIGTDGTQVGLYGGATPFKDKGLPSNPQFLTKTVGNQTDSNGNLQINFKVKAQDN